MGEVVALATVRAKRDAGEPWLSKKQAACHLAVTPRTLTNWQRPVAEGGLGLPHRKLPGGMNLYRRSELDAWVAAQDAAVRCGSDTI